MQANRSGGYSVHARFDLIVRSSYPVHWKVLERLRLLRDQVRKTKTLRIKVPEHIHLRINNSMTRRYKMTINGGSDIFFDHPSDQKLAVMSNNFRAIRVWKSERAFSGAQAEWYELSSQGVQALFMEL